MQRRSRTGFTLVCFTGTSTGTSMGGETGTTRRSCMYRQYYTTAEELPVGLCPGNGCVKLQIAAAWKKRLWKIGLNV